MINESRAGTGQRYHSQIPVYGEWIPTFPNNIKSFYDSMSTTYEPGYKVDRIDKDIGFRPENCYWATNTKSNRDKINDRFIQYNGDILTVSEWNRALGYEPNTIMNRIANGYDDIEAITGKPSDIVPTNAVYFLNEYGRPLNKQSIEESSDK